MIRFCSFLTGLTLVAICDTALADVSLFPLFSDHAVLQASDHVPIWGRATPGENVTVTIGDNVAKGTATAGADGKWSTVLNLQHASEGPFDLVAAGPHNQAKSVDVLIGEVWLCSGQSNMEFVLKYATDGPKDIANSANMYLRHFYVTKNAEAMPADTVQGRWQLSGPATAANFTAVGYYFAKQIQAATHQPVGLIHSSWGGTPIESWISEEGFAASHDPELKMAATKIHDELSAYQKFLADYKGWQQRYNREDHLHSAAAEYTGPAKAGEAGWTAITLPVLFASAGLPDAGATWLQRTITLKETPANRNVTLFLGDIHGSVEIYWNGKKVTTAESANLPQNYRVNSSDLKIGSNVLAVRIFQADRGAGSTSGQIKFSADLPEGTIPLNSQWLAKAEFALPALAAGQDTAPVKTGSARGGAQYVASCLYNGMIAPLVPCAMRGVLWYQGEANAGRGAQYRGAFPLLINDWRARWQRGNFPFYWCQLANYMTRQTQPGEAGWAEVRDAQTSALRLPDTGQAVLIDLGEEADVHYKDKANVGARLARIALAKDYGQKSVVWSGPVFDTMKVEDGGKVRLNFTHADGGLVATPIPATYQPSSLLPETKPTIRHSPGGQLEGFVVCGADRRWHWATTANIAGGDSVLLTCAEVPSPVAVRYAWANNPLCNLANGAGLPAGPFRTDDLPLTTAGAQY